MRLLLPLPDYAARLLVLTLVISVLDCCNVRLTGLLVCTNKPLQMIHNTTANLIFNWSHHFSRLSTGLQWLKALTTTYMIL